MNEDMSWSDKTAVVAGRLVLSVLGVAASAAMVVSHSSYVAVFALFGCISAAGAAQYAGQLFARYRARKAKP